MMPDGTTSHQNPVASRPARAATSARATPLALHNTANSCRNFPDKSFAMKIYTSMLSDNLILFCAEVGKLALRGAKADLSATFGRSL